LKLKLRLLHVACHVGIVEPVLTQPSRPAQRHMLHIDASKFILISQKFGGFQFSIPCAGLMKSQYVKSYLLRTRHQNMGTG
jgi:hypothetical protein